MKRIAAVLILSVMIFSCSKKVVKITELEPPVKEVVVFEEPVVEMVPEPELIIYEKPEEKTVTIYFELNSYEISETEKLKLNKVDKCISVAGGTCDLGTNEYNYELGLKRAEAVQNELRNNGVYVNDVRSFGEDDPISDTREKNRRCVVVWIEEK